MGMRMSVYYWGYPMVLCGCAVKGLWLCAVR